MMIEKKSLLVLFLVMLFTLVSCNAPRQPTVISQNSQGENYPSHLKPLAKVNINTTIRSRYSPNVTYRIVDYSNLPEWSHQYFEQSLRAFKLGCNVLSKQPKWHYVCQVAAQTKNTRTNAKRFFEEHFQPWVVSSNSGGFAGKVTGYYEPAIKGSTVASDRTPYPIYGIPDDFVSIPLPANLTHYKGNIRIKKTAQNSGVISSTGPYFANLSKFHITPKSKALKGRFAGNEFVPYYTRKEIYQGAIQQKAPIIGYAEDPVELFFLQVQGSGRIITPNNKVIRLAYADKNEWPYQSVGKYMAQRGYISLNSASMQGIKQYIQEHPQQMVEILGSNPSFVFFHVISSNEADGPIGALGVPLTDGYSGAVDVHYIDLGAPLFLATTDTRTGKALNRLIMAQDTGSAINGSVRVDFFWGYGDKAGEAAGKTNHPGYVWILLPNSQIPM